LQIEINSGDRVLSECNVLIYDDIKREKSLEDALNVDAPEKISSRGDNEVSESFPADMKTWYDNEVGVQCASLAFNKLKLTETLREMNDWGITYKYLELNATNPLQFVESQYHKDLASGPYSVNMINLAMIIPFLFSAIIDTIISSRKEKTEVASNVGIGLMVAGFVIVVVGLTLIGFSFYQAASPFL
jgi:hypothetical protein